MIIDYFIVIRYDLRLAYLPIVSSDKKHIVVLSCSNHTFHHDNDSHMGEFVCDHEFRVMARDELEALPGSARLFDLERLQRLGEPREPLKSP